MGGRHRTDEFENSRQKIGRKRVVLMSLVGAPLSHLTMWKERLQNQAGPSIKAVGTSDPKRGPG